jgi:hypothetical protein
VDRTLRGPTGPVAGGLRVDELHADRTHEDKLFAPGYGEFRTSGDGDLEALAMAVPTDARSNPEPAGLGAMATGSEATLESARLLDWPAATSTVRRVRAAWRTVRADGPPWRVAERLELDLTGMRTALRRHQPARLGQRAVDVWQSVLDLQLRYRPTTQVDLARMHLWTQQLRVHAARHSPGGVAGATATLEWMRDRVTSDVSATELADLDARLHDVRAAQEAGNLRAAADRAARLGLLLRT